MPLTNAKDTMLQIIADQPEDISYDDLLHELAMARMIERGLEDYKARRIVSHEDVKREVKSWRK